MTPVVRIIGFMMFWIAVGMIIGLLINNVFWGIVIIILLLLCLEKEAFSIMYGFPFSFLLFCDSM